MKTIREDTFCERCHCLIKIGQRWERSLMLPISKYHDPYSPPKHENPEDCIDGLLDVIQDLKNAK